MKKIAIIMAGGSGTRFWPLSNDKTPKQFLNLISEKTMIEETIDRIKRLNIYDDIYIVTCAKYEVKMKEILKDFSNILIEPVSKDTAFCICYSVNQIQMKYGNCYIAIFPSDHLIQDDEKLKKYILKANEMADKNIVIMGIKPTYPETAYGYIKYHENEVIEFREKPNQDTAEKYLEQGNYLWNSGMVFSKSSIFLQEIEKNANNIYENTINSNYDNIYPVSFDIAVLEKTSNLKVIPVDFNWNDVGSFSSLDKIFKKNNQESIVLGDIKHININGKNNIIINKDTDKTIAIIGLEDLIVVNTEKELLICPKNMDQDIKKIKGFLDEKK